MLDLVFSLFGSSSSSPADCSGSSRSLIQNGSGIACSLVLLVVLVVSGCAATSGRSRSLVVLVVLVVLVILVI